MYKYDVTNWYWVVAQSPSQVYSSASASYVDNADATYLAWVAAGGRATSIDTEENLIGVFAAQYPAGWAALQLKADAAEALAKGDITVLRCVENGIAIPAAWVTYRAALRSIIDSGTGTGTMPARPAYPSGT